MFERWKKQKPKLRPEVEGGNDGEMKRTKHAEDVVAMHPREATSTEQGEEDLDEKYEIKG